MIVDTSAVFAILAGGAMPDGMRTHLRQALRLCRPVRTWSVGSWSIARGFRQVGRAFDSWFADGGD